MTSGIYLIDSLLKSNALRCRSINAVENVWLGAVGFLVAFAVFFGEFDGEFEVGAVELGLGVYLSVP